MPKHDSPAATSRATEPESLAQLRRDCAHMAPHWAATVAPAPAPVSPSRIHGVRVPASSAHLLDGMSDYGD
ncbi:hypothetical protein [Streptomyces sp. XD-27]|uniref:hypothetical protein n=1 Tax=Streptomyces sp. XD-27 TaxID=3062779 RepID=UPI0026F41EA5|nr:hypothetical protein [Streptomyces sp. XD-27]WKX69891.1 hypothetical protein Q3Y56_08175 [Streptomyces sp. XD-27]